MVCHPTFKTKTGKWVFPKNVIEKNNSFFLKNNEEVIKGDSQAMSKSKKNIIDPDDIIKIYGADAVRWFILSDSPPDRDIQWSDSGIQGAFKYIQKIWRVCEKIKIYKPAYGGNDAEVLGPAEVCARWNISEVHQVIDMLGMMGDAVDNIPGIAGVGEKTAIQLIKDFGSIENLLDNTEKRVMRKFSMNWVSKLLKR